MLLLATLTSREGQRWDQRDVCRFEPALNASSRLSASSEVCASTSWDDNFDSILKEAKSYSDVHGQNMFGTDIGYLNDYSALTKEYGYMARLGMTFPQILASLTTTPVASLGFAGTTGQIKTGMDADMTLLESDRARDINVFGYVELTIRNGRIIESSTRNGQFCQKCILARRPYQRSHLFIWLVRSCRISARKYFRSSRLRNCEAIILESKTALNYRETSAIKLPVMPPLHGLLFLLGFRPACLLRSCDS